MKLSQTALLSGLFASLPAYASVLPRDNGGKSSNKVPTATIYNFAPKDVVGQYDGLEPHPYAPLRYGKPVRKLDSTGNAVIEHAASINYFNGTYYVYGESWGCGRITFFSGASSFGMPQAPKYNTTGTGSGKCGLPIYSSPNLVDWELAGLFDPVRPEAVPVVSFGPGKQKARFVKSINKYVVWFNAGNGVAFNLQATGSFYYSTSDTPVGPWSTPQQISGNHLAHDYDIADGPDGSVYIVTDVFSGRFDQNAVPLWDVYVQKVNAEMTGTLNTTETTSLIMDKADWEGIGFFENGGSWYITGGPTCANCEVPIWYAKASSPYGPYYLADGRKVADVREGTVLSENGCGAQNKGANVLPTADGGQVVLTGLWGYRTDPQDFSNRGTVQHGSNAQAISSTYWIPQTFDKKGNLNKFTCSAKAVIPLANYHSKSVTAPGPYQPDCRVNFMGGLKQELNGVKTSLLAITVFQQTLNLGPVSQAGNVLNGPLNVTVHYAGGNVDSQLYDPSTQISWEPGTIDVRLNGQPIALTLTSNATNGCFGTMVEPKAGTGKYSYYTTSSNEESKAGQMVMRMQ